MENVESWILAQLYSVDWHEEKLVQRKNPAEFSAQSTVSNTVVKPVLSTTHSGEIHTGFPCPGSCQFPKPYLQTFYRRYCFANLGFYPSWVKCYPGNESPYLRPVWLKYFLEVDLTFAHSVLAGRKAGGGCGEAGRGSRPG